MFTDNPGVHTAKWLALNYKLTGECGVTTSNNNAHANDWIITNEIKQENDNEVTKIRRLNS